MPHKCYNEIKIVGNVEVIKELLKEEPDEVMKTLIGYDYDNYTDDDWVEHCEEILNDEPIL